jgi:hypothetical protein
MKLNVNSLSSSFNLSFRRGGCRLNAKSLFGWSQRPTKQNLHFYQLQAIINPLIMHFLLLLEMATICKTLNSEKV